MIGKTRTMWNLVANRYTIFSKQIEPFDDELIANMTYHMSSQCWLVSLLLMTWHSYLLFSEPHGQVGNSLCPLYTSVYSMEL